MWGIDFERPTATSCSACVEGIKFGGFDPFNPELSFCTCGEGLKLAGLTEHLLARSESEAMGEKRW